MPPHTPISADSRKPRIAVLGSGALGLFYGTRFGAAGFDVRFLFRSDLDVVRQRRSVIAHFPQSGERIELHPVAAFDNTRDIGPVDLVLVTLKTTANSHLGAMLAPLLAPDTAVLTVQNGLGADEHIASLVGAHRVLSGLAIAGATRTAPAEVTVYRAGHLVLGEFSGVVTERTREFAAHFHSAGLRVELVDDVRAARWRKLVWNVPFNGLAIAAGGITTDKICAAPALLARARELMHEVQHIAAAHDVAITDAFVEQQLAGTPPMGAYQPSSLVDYLAGRLIELESIWGEPLRRAQAAGLSAPELTRLYQELRDATRVAKG